MNSLDLLNVARSLVSASENPGDAYLRRAQSSIYYSVFHCLARLCADLFIGADPSSRSNQAWHQVYRALDHAEPANRCRDKDFTEKFGPHIQDFTNQFHNLQDKRNLADYDISESFLLKSSVEKDIELAETAMKVLLDASEKDQRAFCAYILFKRRPHPNDQKARKR